MMPQPIRQGYRRFDETSGCNWFLFPRLTQDQLMDVLDAYHLYSSHSGLGREYQRRPVIHHTATRTLITSNSGLDI